MAHELITAAVFLLGFLAALAPASVLHYYLQQEFGTNELLVVPPARPPVNGTLTGFGMEAVYEFTMTTTADPSSKVLGYVRGTATSVNNTAASTTFFVKNVIHYDDGVVHGSISQQGEAIFADLPWEFSIVGGTGAFRNAYGFNIGKFVSSTTTPSGRVHIVTQYEAHLAYSRFRN